MSGKWNCIQSFKGFLTRLLSKLELWVPNILWLTRKCLETAISKATEGPLSLFTTRLKCLGLHFKLFILQRLRWNFQIIRWWGNPFSDRNAPTSPTLWGEIQAGPKRLCESTGGQVCALAGPWQTESWVIWEDNSDKYITVATQLEALSSVSSAAQRGH